MAIPSIVADFHNADTSGHVRLNTLGTLESLSLTGLQLTDGMCITVHDDELEADGVAHFSTDERIWVAQIDWDAIRPHTAPARAHGT